MPWPGHPAAFAPSLAVAAPLPVLASLSLAPLNACVYRLLDELAPAGTATEASTWLTTANAAGAAIDAAVAGAISQTPPGRSPPRRSPVPGASPAPAAHPHRGLVGK